MHGWKCRRPVRMTAVARRWICLVLHYTGMATAEAALARLCDPAAKVSAHYTIDEAGTVYAHVPEARRAWHAGKILLGRRRPTSMPAPSVLNWSIRGMNLVIAPLRRRRLRHLKRLCRDILARHPIPAARVLGHSDVAPTRKIDPGELFPWAASGECGYRPVAGVLRPGNLGRRGVGAVSVMIPPIAATDKIITPPFNGISVPMP